MLINKTVIVIFIAHVGLSIGGFLSINGGAVAAQDGGVSAPVLAWLEIPLHYGLLQPLAYWVLQTVPIAWWTWQGLGLLLALFVLNSGVFTGVLAGLLQKSRTWRRPT